MARIARLGLCASLALIIAGCGPAGQQPLEQPVEELTLWRPIGTWKGRGPTQTEAFIGQTGAFRLQWEARQSQPSAGGAFKVVLHSSVSGRPLLTVVDHPGPGVGEAQVTEDPREFFLVIEAAGLEWSLRLDEAVRATRPAAGTL
jgi:hypothetical protein